MGIKLETDEAKAAIRSESFGMNGLRGGPQKSVYYTPDGRRIEAFPMIRDYAKKDANGKVIAQGQRDANLDKGWLTSMPAKKALFCPSCTRWHDTKAQVAACKQRQQEFEAIALAKANKEEAKKTESLEAQVAKLTKMVEKLTGGTNGRVLQHSVNEPNRKIPGRNGHSAKGVQQ